jgi:hypothetical protein
VNALARNVGMISGIALSVAVFALGRNICYKRAYRRRGVHRRIQMGAFIWRVLRAAGEYSPPNGIKLRYNRYIAF